MNPLPRPTVPPVPKPDIAQPQPVQPAEEAPVHLAVPVALPGVVTAYSSADDMDFDIVSTRG
jgi:hypothetical protein